jgi:hypothetical protein
VLGRWGPTVWRALLRTALAFALLVGSGLILGVNGAGATQRTFTINYTGDYAWHQDWEGSGTSAGSYLRTDETLSWVLKVHGTVPPQGQPVGQAALVEQGSISEHGSNPAPVNDSCTIHQLPHGGAPDFTVYRAGAKTLNITVSIPTDAQVSGCPQDLDGNQVPLFCTPQTCAGATVCGAVPPVFHKPAFLDAFQPTLTDFDSGSQPFDVNGPQASEKVACSSGGTESTQVLINSTVSVNGGGPVTHKPGKPHIPEIERQKVFATSDLLTTLLRAEASCGQVVAGTLAHVWGTTVSSGGVAAVLTGAIILAGSAPTCVALLKRAIDDCQIINDPPRTDVFAVARPSLVRVAQVNLPSCAGRPGTVRAFCQKLRADELKYVAAVRSATRIDDAFLTTVDRESGAARTHKKAALSLQERTADHLERQLKSASGSERRAGGKLTVLLHSRHVVGRLTAAQDGAAIAYLRSQLAHHGIGASRIPRRALRVGSINLVSLFGS